MLEIDRVQTLQYMGSKSRMLNSICTPIIQNNEIHTVIDLFAGTGSVGFALSPYKRIISNDLEYYAYILNDAVLNGCNLDRISLDSIKREIVQKYNRSSSFVAEAIDEEKRFFESSTECYEEYSKFSDETPSVFNPKTDNSKLKCIEKLVSKIHPGKYDQDVPFSCLFLTYYANAYFGIKQSCQIDAIASQILECTDERIRNVLFAALMSALSVCASTTTHFAQFLKVKSKGTFKNIIEKRSQDIFELFDEAIKRFAEKGLLERTDRRHDCYNMDFMDLLDGIEDGDKTTVYADPPYFKEHYSRYYHVLNTLCRYDYPEPAINPQTKKYSVGRYRTDRSVSDFGKRAKVIDAFRRMINTCADKGMNLVISYSENSLVKIFEILKLAEERYHVRVDKVQLKHSSQGRATDSDQNVKEFLFFCDCPDGAEVKIKRFADELKEIKPIVDNPGGFIHNYMARKPYNVVSKIIEEFTNVGDTVFDPMFGSGTTLIEASKLSRKAIGCDINPIAYRLCNISLKKWDLNQLFIVIDRFVESVENECNDIYQFEENGQRRVIERCHFDMIDGNMIPVSYWYKEDNNGKLSGRRKSEANSFFLDSYSQYSKHKLSRINNSQLIPNSRIAIKEKTSVFDYFCNRNLYALDKIFMILDDYKCTYGYEVLEVLVSSSINLIKLSDKKASSQMPYWLPQKNVTSRNACFIIRQKAKAIKDGLSYLDQECMMRIEEGVNIYNVPAQSIGKSELKRESVDLILTDPPYTDQVPYLEYSQLWFDLFGIEKGVKYANELVVSDAPSRKKDYEDFNKVLHEIIRRSSNALKQNALFILFYHTFDLKSWSRILKMMAAENLKYLYQIPTAAPRKSFKTVMSPRSTLDGNYLLFFTKCISEKKVTFTGSVEEAVQAACECAERIIRSQEHVTTQDLYDSGMLKESFDYGYLDVIANHYKTFADVIKERFNYIDGYWEVKE